MCPNALAHRVARLPLRRSGRRATAQAIISN